MRDTLRAEMMDWIGHELKTPVQSLGLASDLLNRQREDVDDSLGILIDTVRQDTAVSYTHLFAECGGTAWSSCRAAERK